ncbi:SWI/SNF and RSC complex subunit Ssr3 [Marasmius crinis-equi]|uniref:SWI/SNF and RSC complex subunit Ssr3 n=1 Tax=Marasmius crinis-equi TaxID=585013 RepID=A0ABR3EN67_9AGAR
MDVKAVKRRKLSDKSLPTAILQNPDFAEDSKMYQSLLDMERKLDWVMTRKKVEVHSFGRGVSTNRTPRLLLSHIVSRQAWQPQEEDSTGETNVPAWELKIERRVLELPNQRSKDKGPPREFSTLIKRLGVELDRDPKLYPESNNVERPRATGSYSPVIDGFTVRRTGDAPANYKVAPELGALHALWNYININGLQDKNDKQVVDVNDPLRQLQTHLNPYPLIRACSAGSVAHSPSWSPSDPSPNVKHPQPSSSGKKCPRCLEDERKPPHTHTRSDIQICAREGEAAINLDRVVNKRQRTWTAFEGIEGNYPDQELRHKNDTTSNDRATEEQKSRLGHPSQVPPTCYHSDQPSYHYPSHPANPSSRGLSFTTNGTNIPAPITFNSPSFSAHPLEHSGMLQYTTLQPPESSFDAPSQSNSHIFNVTDGLYNYIESATIPAYANPSIYSDNALSTTASYDDSIAQDRVE